MASFVYGLAAELMIEQTLDWISDGLKVGLSDSTHVPAKDDQFLDDVGSDDFIDGELTGSGYVAGFGNSGRQVLGTPTVVYDVGNTRVELSGTNITWTGIDAGTIEHATVLKEITNDAASIVVVEIDLATQVTNGGDITIQWDAEGIVQLTV